MIDIKKNVLTSAFAYAIIFMLLSFAYMLFYYYKKVANSG